MILLQCTQYKDISILDSHLLNSVVSKTFFTIFKIYIIVEFLIDSFTLNTYLCSKRKEIINYANGSQFIPFRYLRPKNMMIYNLCTFSFVL